MKYILLIFFYCISSFLFSQEKFEWNLEATYAIDSSDIWATDVLGNVYITKKEVIHKYDSVGILKFSQSQKSIGRLTSLSPINTMKLVVFSEEQQIFCLLDNTLTPYESCIDLLDHNIGNATKIAVSSQPNKFWVYDQLNSRLHLLSLLQSEQSQEVENLKGMLNSFQISFMLEYNNLLYIVDSTQGVFILDMYGSLVNSLKRKNINAIQVDLDNIYLLENEDVTVIQLETNKETKIGSPVKNAIEFRMVGNSFYFRTNTEIKKYKLLFKE